MKSPSILFIDDVVSWLGVREKLKSLGFACRHLTHNAFCSAHQRGGSRSLHADVYAIDLVNQKTRGNIGQSCAQTLRTLFPGSIYMGFSDHIEGNGAAGSQRHVVRQANAACLFHALYSRRHAMCQVPERKLGMPPQLADIEVVNARDIVDPTPEEQMLRRAERLLGFMKPLAPFKHDVELVPYDRAAASSDMATDVVHLVPMCLKTRLGEARANLLDLFTSKLDLLEGSYKKEWSLAFARGGSVKGLTNQAWRIILNAAEGCSNDATAEGPHYGWKSRLVRLAGREAKLCDNNRSGRNNAVKLLQRLHQLRPWTNPQSKPCITVRKVGEDEIILFKPHFPNLLLHFPSDL